MSEQERVFARVVYKGGRIRCAEVFLSVFICFFVLLVCRRLCHSVGELPKVRCSLAIPPSVSLASAGSRSSREPRSMARYQDLRDARDQLRPLCLHDEAWSVRVWCRQVEYARIDGFEDYTVRDRVALALDAWHLLPRSGEACPRCEKPRSLVPVRESRRDKYPFGLAWQCKCESARSVLEGTVWSRRAIEQLVPATFLFAADYRPALIASEFHMHEPHLQEWLENIRELMAADVLGDDLPVSGKVGGPGIRVKVDEAFLNRPKRCALPFRHSARQANSARWLWGAVSDDGLVTGDVSLLLLPDADAPRGAMRLRAALLKCVEPGSIVVHDDWGAYRSLDWSSLPFEHDARCVVNHSKEITNAFGENTNAIEAVWSTLKRWLRARHGGRLPHSRRILELDIWEFVWRRRAGVNRCVPELMRLLRGTQQQ